ncbi:MAG: response regulator, partial [Patescibacteria group bacterium]
MEIEDERRNDEPVGTDCSVDDERKYAQSGEPVRSAVLIVDDDGAWRVLGRIYAERAFPDCNIVEAKSAEAAITALSRKMWEGVVAILSDIVMPGLSGMEFARVLRGEAVKVVRVN